MGKFVDRRSICRCLIRYMHYSIANQIVWFQKFTTTDLAHIAHNLDEQEQLERYDDEHRPRASTNMDDTGVWRSTQYECARTNYYLPSRLLLCASSGKCATGVEYDVCLFGRVICPIR